MIGLKLALMLATLQFQFVTLQWDDFPYPVKADPVLYGTTVYMGTDKTHPVRFDYVGRISQAAVFVNHPTTFFAVSYNYLYMNGDRLELISTPISYDLIPK